MDFGINSFLVDSCVKASPNNLKMKEHSLMLRANTNMKQRNNLVQHSNNTG